MSKVAVQSFVLPTQGQSLAAHRAALDTPQAALKLGYGDDGNGLQTLFVPLVDGRHTDPGHNVTVAHLNALFAEELAFAEIWAPLDRSARSA
jgi:hypothetical protein